MTNIKYKTVTKTSDLYQNMNQFNLGEIFYNQEADQFFIMGEKGLIQVTKEYLEEVDKTVDSLQKIDGNVSMTMYEMNQQIISQLPTHDEEKIKEDIEIINQFEKTQNTKYYMLLCKEISYFTGFIKEITSTESLGEVVIDCIKPVGCIKDIDNSDPLCVDIWITTKEGETHCMHLFDYQYGVVEFGG